MSETTESINRQPPKISIVLATLNVESTIHDCLESIQKQSVPPWELLVKDGGSTDGTLKCLNAHQDDFDWFVSKGDNGIYEAWNIALDNATGDYIWFLGADDQLYHKCVLEEVLSAIGEDRYHLVTTQGAIVDEGKGTTRILGGPWNHRKIGRRMIVCHPGLLHHRSLFEKFGKFNEKYSIAADLEFLLRLPDGLTTKHLETTSVLVGNAGISRQRVLARLKEQRDVLSRCERYGPTRAYIAWLDKLWRYPIAKLLGLPH